MKAKSPHSHIARAPLGAQRYGAAPIERIVLRLLFYKYFTPTGYKFEDTFNLFNVH